MAFDWDNAKGIATQQTRDDDTNANRTYSGRFGTFDDNNPATRGTNQISTPSQTAAPSKYDQFYDLTRADWEATQSYRDQMRNRLVNQTTDTSIIDATENEIQYMQANALDMQQRAQERYGMRATGATALAANRQMGLDISRGQTQMMTNAYDLQKDLNDSALANLAGFNTQQTGRALGLMGDAVTMESGRLGLASQMRTDWRQRRSQAISDTVGLGARVAAGGYFG